MNWGCGKSMTKLKVTNENNAKILINILQPQCKQKISLFMVQAYTKQDHTNWLKYLL